MVLDNFYFHLPEGPGEMIQFDEHIFQMGWFNHQLVLIGGFPEAFMRHTKAGEVPKIIVQAEEKIVEVPQAQLHRKSNCVPKT